MIVKAEGKNIGAGETTTNVSDVAEHRNGADAGQPSAPGKEKPARKTEATDIPEKFKATLAQLDTERTTLAKAAIEQLKPGRPFDPVAVRKINEIERKKNRLLVSRFAFLLRRNSADVQAIVHQIIEL